MISVGVLSILNFFNRQKMDEKNRIDQTNQKLCRLVFKR
jgi:hypothetical protein